MNLELVIAIFDILQTMKEATKQMIAEYESGNMEEFKILSVDLSDGLDSVKNIAEQQGEKGKKNQLRDACVSAIDSLNNVLLLVSEKNTEALWKMECELLMIIENATLEFFCNHLMNQCDNPREDMQTLIMDTGLFAKGVYDAEEYSCDLSIFVPAYNNLEYTKLCVQSILDNIPEEINAELILLNHGCSDGTREYFESLSDVHVINMAINRAVNLVAMRAMKGKYSLYVSNDIVIGKNAIRNMYRAISEHEDYGWIVPSTSAVSNLQTIEINYSDLDEFQEFAKKNNIYDEKRHESRVRLCNPVTMIKTNRYHALQADMYKEMYCITNVSSFPDDKISIWMRRHGYKNILQKDAYCHHFGSITHKNDFKEKQQENEFYLEGRRKFFYDFGVDPWGVGMCYESNIFKAWSPKLQDGATVLGINCGLGSNSLKVKEILRENGAKDVRLYNATQDGRFYYDLQGISDEAFLFWRLRDLIELMGVTRFDYIVIENEIEGNEGKDSLEKIKNAGISYGELLLKTSDQEWQIIRN